MALNRLQTLIDDARRRRGRWRLTPGHEIEYRGRDGSEEFTLRGPIIAVEPGQIVFSVTEKTEDQKTVTRLVRLAGRWKAGRRNEIIFSVDSRSGRSGELTFKSGWRLGERYEILYTVRRTDLKTRRKISQDIVFSGRWAVSEKNRLVFSIGGDDRSRLSFRGAFQTPSILAKRGEIRYRLGTGAEAGPGPKTLVFFGDWKVSRDFGLSFELETGERRKPALTFGGQWHFDGSSRVSFELRSLEGGALGAEVVFSKDVSGDGEFFAAAGRSRGETRAEAGVRWTA